MTLNIEILCSNFACLSSKSFFVAYLKSVPVHLQNSRQILKYYKKAVRKKACDKKRPGKRRVIKSFQKKADKTDMYSY